MSDENIKYLDFESYTVQPNDTVNSIAVKFQITSTELCKANKWSCYSSVSKTLFTNQVINIPTAQQWKDEFVPKKHHHHCDYEEDEDNDKNFVKESTVRRILISHDLHSELHVEDFHVGTLMSTPEFLVFEPSFNIVTDNALDTSSHSCSASRMAIIEKFAMTLELNSLHSLALYRNFHDLSITLSLKHRVKKKEEAEEEEEEEDIEQQNTQKVTSKTQDLIDSMHLSEDILLCFGSDGPPQKERVNYIFCLSRSSGEQLLSFVMPLLCKETTTTMSSEEGLLLTGGSSNSFLRRGKDNEDGSNSNFSSSNSVSDEENDVTRGLQELATEDYCVPLLLDRAKDQSEILTEAKAEDLAKHFPAHLVGSNLRLMYMASRDGFSLSSMYRAMKTIDDHVPTLLLILDSNDVVFGACMSDKMQVSQLFYGKGSSSFVFHWAPAFRRYEWTRKNHYFMKGDVKAFSIGVKSGHNAIWFEETLNKGRSEESDTFDNPVLCGGESSAFCIHAIELWAFTSSCV